jgi:RES domain-containing protein
MPADEQTLGAIDSLGVSRWSGSLYRHTAPNREPLSGEGARIFGGRWNPPESFPTIYFADSVDTCEAEFLRMAEAQGVPPRSFLPRSLHTVPAEDLELLDVSTQEQLARVKLRLGDVIADDRKACQDVGEGAYFLGMQGIRAPSAVGSGLVVTVFNLRLRPAQLRVVETTELRSLSR